MVPQASYGATFEASSKVGALRLGTANPRPVGEEAVHPSLRVGAPPRMQLAAERAQVACPPAYPSSQACSLRKRLFQDQECLQHQQLAPRLMHQTIALVVHGQQTFSLYGTMMTRVTLG
mmetsp:Transcript_16084/g.34792  ORF Transcript_16084/g.34792 Transcript_16084/m.34792 type:complete len:119 (+) Transcript_16084:323-679(+)